MKSNFTYQRICLFISLFSLSFTNSFSQTTSTTEPAAIINLKATVQNSSLVINWHAIDAEMANYSEIQASEDGKNFSTIGLVMGADPKQANSYTFKQDIKKLKPGRSYYRVVTINTNNVAYASDIVNLSK